MTSVGTVKIKINKNKKVDIEKYPMVEVRWTDIVSDPAWISLDDLKNSKLAVCITKGHLLSQKNGITRLFGDYALNEKDPKKIEEVGNSTIIPNSNIIKIKKI
jgi:hypothetical protein